MWAFVRSGEISTAGKPKNHIANAINRAANGNHRCYYHLHSSAARIRMPAEPKITPLHEYNFKSHSIVNAGTKKKEKRTENEMWFVAESKVFQCIGVEVLATGSKVYLETAWNMRQCKIRLCSSEETLFVYIRIPGMCLCVCVMKEVNANESRARKCWYCNVRHLCIVWMVLVQNETMSQTRSPAHTLFRSYIFQTHTHTHTKYHFNTVFYCNNII